MSKPHIEKGLALALAGQISVGLTPGDDQDRRAHMALFAIGLMLSNATDDSQVHEALAVSSRGHVEVKDGVTTYRWSADA